MSVTLSSREQCSGKRVEQKPDRSEFARLALQEAGRSLRAGAGAVLRTRLVAPPRRLLFAPQDLRTADPTVAADLYAGSFVFAGRALATGGRSPFEFRLPSRAWGEVLHGFGWLRHLRAADTALAAAHARALVDQFELEGHGDQRLARETPVLARRLISYLSQSPLLLNGADHAFYDRFLRAVGRAVRQLERDAVASARPDRRLVAAIALAFAGLACEGYGSLLRRATRILARELDAQILADGGPVSRNPRRLLELLLDLLSLRQLYASRGLEPPPALMRAIDRALPFLRTLRHPDGRLALFNGMGRTDADHLATVLVYHEAHAPAPARAPHSGYERLQAGPTVVIADVGGPPPVHHSCEAGAGCLSFEMSSGGQRIVTNCGAPQRTGEALSEAARATAAHSTVTVDRLSSAEFLVLSGSGIDRRLARRLLRRLGPVILRGPGPVAVERGEQAGWQRLRARHDGYVRAVGLFHERRWQLSLDGDQLAGEDVFTGEGMTAREAAIRFHLAPGIAATETGDAVLLALPGGETWRFESEGAKADIAESAFFAASDRTRRTDQIVVTVDPRNVGRLRWSFTREDGGEGSGRQR
jgi:uncharacterized heparinase superfamily protein